MLIVLDDDVPNGKEKINLEILYEIFKEAPSHSLVSLQFLSAQGIFFGIEINIYIYQKQQIEI